LYTDFGKFGQQFIVPHGIKSSMDIEKGSNNSVSPANGFANMSSKLNGVICNTTSPSKSRLENRENVVLVAEVFKSNFNQSFIKFAQVGC
jgi:hypothetical protein